MGSRALAASRETFPAVSSPERVVRSMQVTARRSQAACHSFLTVRRLGRGGSPALDRAPVYPDGVDQLEVEGHPGVAGRLRRRLQGAVPPGGPAGGVVGPGRPGRSYLVWSRVTFMLAENGADTSKSQMGQELASPGPAS